jgi:hypothetical protein
MNLNSITRFTETAMLLLKQHRNCDPPLLKYSHRQDMQHSNYKPQQSTLIASSGHGTQKLQGTTNCSDNQDVRNSMAAKNNHSGILAIELDEITNVQYVLLCFPNVQYVLFLMVPNVQI